MSSSSVRPADPVITGVGAVTPVGLDVASTWESLVNGRSGIGEITAFDATGLDVRIAAEVKGFDGEAVVGTKRFRRSSRASQFAVAAAREAIADAGLDAAGEESAIDGRRLGVVLNCAVGGVLDSEHSARKLISDGPRDVSPYYVPSMLTNMPACEVAIDTGAHGPVVASALACASGNAALLEARRIILAGEADLVIAGGTDAGITPLMFAGLTNMGALSARNGDPAGASRPFDLGRTGFVYGEGAVTVIVESAEHARARGARVYATLLGGALTSDAFHISHPLPSGEHVAQAISLALERTGTAPEELDYIVAHGTGTRINDLMETRAIRQVCGGAADGIPISSPKSVSGHLLGAAGALSVLAAVCTMRDGVIAPTINLDTPDPECDLDYVPLVAREAEVRTVMVDAFGFGGQNCVIVLGPAD